MHKQGNPARPVVLMIDTPEYNLAKFLDQIIKPYIPNQFVLDSTFHLLDKLKEFSPSPHQIIVSFDVVLYYYVKRYIASNNNSNLDTKSHLSTEIVFHERLETSFFDEYF